MTDLKKAVTRVSYGLVREAGKHRNVQIRLSPPNVLSFKAKGCRTWYSLTAEHCYLLAVKADVADKKRQKKKEKKALKGD